MSLTKEQLRRIQADGVALRKAKRMLASKISKKIQRAQAQARAVINKAERKHVTYKPWPNRWYKMPGRAASGVPAPGYRADTVARTLSLYHAIADCVAPMYSTGVRVRCWNADSAWQGRLGLSRIAPGWGSVVVTKQRPLPAALALSVYWQPAPSNAPAFPYVYAVELVPVGATRYTFRLSDRNLQQFASSPSVQRFGCTNSTQQEMKIPMVGADGMLGATFRPHLVPVLAFLPETTQHSPDWATPMVHAVQSWAMDIPIPGPMM